MNKSDILYWGLVGVLSLLFIWNLISKDWWRKRAAHYSKKLDAAEGLIRAIGADAVDCVLIRVAKECDILYTRNQKASIDMHTKPLDEQQGLVKALEADMREIVELEKRFQQMLQAASSTLVSCTITDMPNAVRQSRAQLK